MEPKERALFLEDKLGEIPTGSGRREFMINMLKRRVLTTETAEEILKLRKLKGELSEKLSPEPPPPPPAPAQGKPLSNYQEGATYRDKRTGVMRRYLQGQFV
jgi:hypothetical protein